MSRATLTSINKPHTDNIFTDDKGRKKTVEWRTKPLPKGLHYVYETKQEINELLELQKEVKQGLRPKLPCAEDEAIFYITDSGKIVTRFARNFKIMGSLGIEIEATAWERNKENPNALELHTTIIHSGEFGKRAFFTKAEAEEGVAELAKQRLAQED